MKSKLPPARFRRQLKDELVVLEAEGFLTADQTRGLTDRYRLTELGAETMQSLLTTIYVIGSVLIGIGIISFVAAHWNDMGRGVKLGLIFVAMLVAHAGGFYLWKVNGRFPKLGHTLVLLGTLIFGANIGLIAQIFHIRENPFQGFLFWCIGASVVAYAVQSVPNAILALIGGIIYSFGAVESYHPIAIWWPFYILVVFVPLVYMLKSQAVAGLTAGLYVLSMVMLMSGGSLFHGECGIIEGLVITGLGVLAWGLLRQPVAWGNFVGAPVSFVGVFSLSLAAFLFSFHQISDFFIQVNLLTDWNWAVFTHPIGILFLLSLAMMVLAAIRGMNRIQYLLLATGTVIGAGALFRFPGMTYFELTIAGNALFLLMDCVLFYASFVYEDRRIFWASVLMAVTLVVARTLEYETELLIKAAVFTGCGIGLIVAGVFFERYLRDRRQAHV